MTRAKHTNKSEAIARLRKSEDWNNKRGKDVEMWKTNKEELRKINVEEIMTQVQVDIDMRDGIFEYLGRNGFDERTATAAELLWAVMEMYDYGLFYKEE